MRRMATAVALVMAVAAAALPSPASAHPLGNYTVNRAVAIEIGSSIAVRYVVDMAEIPAFETIDGIDADADGAITDAEGGPWAADTCDAASAALVVSVDGRPVALAAGGEPSLSFPPGAGGLPTLRLECRFMLPDARTSGYLTVVDAHEDGRVGWREVTASAVGDARIVAADVPAESESALLTAYPEDRLAEPPDVRHGSVRYRLGAAAAPGLATTVPPSQDGLERQTASDPLAALIGGGLNPGLIALALLVSLGLGAVHALSPGHGKTLVAAYVLGAGGTARSALHIGLWVAVSHTAGVFVLGVVTLLASQFILPERVIGWLSLGSGLVVTILGLFLLARVLLAHGHGHGHDHDHHHPPRGGLTARAALALGFAGGAVPSASAVIVLLVAISTDRLLLGSLLIATFGIGMACVLGGLALAVARIGSVVSSSGGWLSSPLVRRIGALVPAMAGVAVLVTGVAFTVAAVSQLA